MTHSVFQAKTNGFVLGLDASSSMLRRDWRTGRDVIKGSNAEKLIQVVDQEIRRLADLARKGERDPETGLLQEYRVSIFQFASRGQYQMLIWEMDPRSLVDSGMSIADVYKPYGNTAMCEGINYALTDLDLIPQRYGDRATLFYVFGDGAENNSSYEDQEAMKRRLRSLPDNITMAMFVPDEGCAATARRWGIPAGNVRPWDATSENGVFEVGRMIEQASTTWMENRGKGLRSTPDLFGTGVKNVNDETVKGSLVKLDPRSYKVFVSEQHDCQIRDFLTGKPWRDGTPIEFKPRRAYYMLTKREKIQPDKSVLIMDTRTDEVYGGDHARAILGLKDEAIERGPDWNPNYRVFILSGSVNRTVHKGDIVIWKP